MLRLLTLTAAGIFSYFLFNILTDPHSKVKNKLPNIQIKWIQIFPNVSIRIRGRIIVVHHWMGLSLILIISIVIGGSFIDSALTKGFLLGGIVQGFRYPDWKRIVLKK